MSDKKLYRSRGDRLILGVCAGLAKYFNMDPLVMRLIFIILVLLQGFGVLVYVVLFIVIPNEPGEYVEVNRKEKVKEMFKKVEEKAEAVAEEVRHEAKSVKDEFNEDKEKEEENSQ